MEQQNTAPQAPHKSNKTLGIVLGIIVVFAVAFVAIFSNKKSGDVTTGDQTGATTAQTAPVVTTPVSTTTTVTATTASSTYKDGTYSATGTYMSPGGQDRVGVTLTLANDIVTSATVTPEPGDNESARYQNKFVSGYKQYVVGQNIADIHLTRVSGSSLTPIGFQNALTQIEAQAQA